MKSKQRTEIRISRIRAVIFSNELYIIFCLIYYLASKDKIIWTDIAWTKGWRRTGMCLGLSPLTECSLQANQELRVNKKFCEEIKRNWNPSTQRCSCQRAGPREGAGQLELPCAHKPVSVPTESPFGVAAIAVSSRSVPALPSLLLPAPHGAAQSWVCDPEPQNPHLSVPVPSSWHPAGVCHSCSQKPPVEVIPSHGDSPAVADVTHPPATAILNLLWFLSCYFFP